MNARILIVLSNPGGVKTLPVAFCDNRELLVTAAREAVQVRRQQAESIAGIDAGLGRFATREATRVESILRRALPELQTAALQA